MKKSPPWQLVLQQYKYSRNPQIHARCQIFLAAIGLQGVDGLDPSGYFVTLAEKYIQGKLTLSALERNLRRYYRWCKWSAGLTKETWEADLVSLHIVQLLSTHDFRFSPKELQKIHHRLFEDVYDFAGDFRTYDIRKKEWILKGSSVKYLDSRYIARALRDTFDSEAGFSYEGRSGKDCVRRLARFISAVWLIHPYGEGNTRTTALFLIRYLQSQGYRMNLTTFVDSWYFRNALVRANYQDKENHIVRNYQYLEAFLGNLLLKEENPLRNQELHLDYPNI